MGSADAQQNQTLLQQSCTCVQGNSCFRDAITGAITGAEHLVCMTFVAH